MDIYIFHYNMRQAEKIYWLIIARGAIFYVRSWHALSPVESRQQEDEMMFHPHYLEGKTQLPRFYLKTSGELEVKDGHAIIQLPQV